MNSLLPVGTHGNTRPAQAAVLRVNDPLYGWRTRPIHDLIMIRGAKGYSWLHWRDGSRHIMAYTLKHYEMQLPASAYIRIHQNCLVNRAFVQKVQLTHKGPMLLLSTGEKVAVSRRRWVAVKRALSPNPWTGLVEDSASFTPEFAASELQ